MSNFEKRDIWQSLKRGFGCHCPACGKGNIFNAYLKVAPKCDACGEELDHHRADDAPPYFTIFVVGHVVGAGILFVEEQDYFWPVWLHAVVWCSMTIGLSLWLLPKIKGALVGYQWALRMHGFGRDDVHPDPALPENPAPSRP
jgi:uncharacterized protein (DUF983 family)